MILLCGCVEFSVIYTHPPSRDGSLRDKFIFVVFNDRHASLLGHNLHGANPLAMWHRIDYPGVQEFQDLFLDNFSHRIVEPTLRLLGRCFGRVYRNAMRAEGRANSLKVLERVAEHGPILL